MSNPDQDLSKADLMLIDLFQADTFPVSISTDECLREALVFGNLLDRSGFLY